MKLPSIFGKKKEERVISPKFLKKGLLKEPGAALDAVKKEMERLAGLCSEMVGGIMDMFRRKDPDFLHGIEDSYEKVEALYGIVHEYLTRLFQSQKNCAEVERETLYLSVLNELKQISSVVYRDIFPLTVEFTESDLFFSPEGWKQMNDYHFRIYSGVKKAIEAFNGEDTKMAKAIADEKMEVVLLGKRNIKLHIDRLHRGLKESLETSAIHLDLISQMRRINSFSTNIAYMIMGGD